MELDDLKNSLAQQTQLTNKHDVKNIKSIENRVSQYSRILKRQTWIETSVAVFAFVSVLMALFFGETLYPKILQELLPKLAASKPTIHPLMYFSFVLAAFYFLWTPIKIYLSQQVENRYGWALATRIEAEIKLLQQQKALWSNVQSWSFLPAIVIGTSFFWGFQVSLLGSWVPSTYLIGYFIFIGLTTWGGLQLKRRVLEKEVTPLLDELYEIKRELTLAEVK